MHAMMLFYSHAYTGTEAAPDPAVFERVVAGHLAYERDVLRPRVTVVVGQALQPASAAQTVRFAADGTAVDKGPYAEAEQALGGFYLIECADLAEATDLAARYPMPPGFGCIEVRPVIGFDPELRRQVVGDVQVVGDSPVVGDGGM
jgi:hypothetical protein